MTTRLAYYNEIDPFCCDVLRARIADGLLPPGDVDPRDIRDVTPADLEGYGQVHLFAGIGGGGFACRLAGVPDDFRLITAGVPCQPASQAGKRLGAADERWLWPEFFRLLRGLGSHYALVEQPPGIVSLNDGAEWGDILGTLAEIREDLEVSRVSAGDVGAPQERERLWIVAYPDGEGRGVVRQPERAELEGTSRRVTARCDEGMVDTASGRLAPQSLDRSRGEAARERQWSGDAGDGCEPVGDASSGGRRARGQLAARRADGGCEGVGHASGAGREERDAAAISGDTRYAAGECGGMGDAELLRRSRDAEGGREALHGSEQPRRAVGDSGRAGIQYGADARGARLGRREDEGEGIQRERCGRDARDHGEQLRPWADAVPVRGYDGTVRLIPREAAEAGPESPLWPVVDGLPGRVARLRAIGNAWCPEAAVVPLTVILEHAEAIA